MGSAASLNEYHLDAVVQAKYRREIAALFAEEFIRLKNTKAPPEDLENEFVDVLQEKEPAILRKIGLETDYSNSKKGSFRVVNSYVDEEAEFRKLCVDTVDKIRTKNAMTLLCCVDGSEGADTAFRTMMRLRKRLDHVCLMHAYTKSHSSSLPTHYEPDFIQEHYEAELIATYRVPVSRFALYWEDRRGRASREVLMDMLLEYRGAKTATVTRQEPHLLFCGYVGRKGRKVDETSVGSFTDLALRNCHMPIVICKSLCPPSSRVFVVAVDGSPLSKRGFDLAMTIINPRDILHVVNVYNPRKTGSGCEPPPEEIEEFYEKELEHIGPANSRFKTVICSAGNSVARSLVEYSNEVGADFFVISPRTRPYLSPKSEYIICHVNASVVLCKN
eukprot:CAMPEP_0185029160 /NCGR_PEP_ID=MMETSP1103-20130426/15294_1 /TAXON_ID=36769 /ORGANISM="Paraphysomonas bandaiensis, Strain Caron Lab Isolate" /LENGTH=388 /DNA_ID=CAMNT_0027563805 /DNA_START=38 /DNA_END=1204 /DNA_ORIENTATION=+